MGELLTNSERDGLWETIFSEIELMKATSLRRANKIECLKELHRIGQITDKDYSDELWSIFKSEDLAQNSDSIIE